MRINKKVLAWCVAAAIVIIVAIVLALPPLVRYLAIKKIDEATGRKSQIAKVSINPFTLKAELTGVRLSEKGSPATFISLSSARLALSPLSLPKRSFIINELQLSSPYLHVVRDAPFHYNFSDLLAPKKEEKKKGTPLFSVNNIIVKHGALDFDDRALSPHKFHRLREMSVSIPFVSNMPYLANRYVTPHFSAVVNGSPVRFDGRLKPLTKAVEASLSLKLKEVDLPYYLAYLPYPPPVRITSGRLATALEVGYRVDEKIGPEVRVSGDATLHDVAVKEPNGAPLAAMEEGSLKVRNAELWSRKAAITALDLKGVDLHVSRERSGRWNFQRLFEKGKPPEKKEKAAEEGQKEVELTLAKLTLKGGKIHLSDNIPPGSFKTDLLDVEGTVQDFSLAKGHKSPVELRFRTARKETAALKGELVMKPASFRGELALTALPMKDYYPYLSDILASPVSGTIAFNGQLIYDEKGNIIVEKGVLKGERVDVPFGSGEGWRVREAVANGIAVDLKRRKALVERIDLRGGTLSFSSSKEGLSYERLLKPKHTPPQSRRKKGGAKEAEAAPFSYRFAKVNGRDIGIKFTDRTKEDEPSFTLTGMNFSVSDITGPKQGTFPLTLASRYGGKGSIRASGRLTPQPLKFRGNVDLHGIPLRDFDAYMPEDVYIFIAEGALDTKMALDVEKTSSGIRGSYAGSAGIRSFYCQDTVTDEDLLKWESLQMDRIRGTVSPFTIAVSGVSLSNFYSRVIVEKDGTLNLQHLTAEKETRPATPPPRGRNEMIVVTGGKKAGAAPPAPPAPVPAPAPAPAPPSAPAGQPAQAGGAPRTSAKAAATAPKPLTPGGESAAQPHPIRIDTITMQGGTLAFSDRHLQSPFNTTFYNLGGRVSGLTSEAGKVADVDLRGNLENHSPLSIKGSINPLRGDLYLDMKLSFTDIELSPFTPYSNTYLGYMIAKGKVSLDLIYHIDRKALSSQNKVFIDQFTFGKKVDSPRATKLPVRLAIALLKDRNGEIHLDLPVAGRTDDPKFSIWKVVLQMMKNLVIKAATAPMALLGSLFGGQEDFSAVSFPAGSARLEKAQQEKLAKFAKALHDRPALDVEISGFVDRERDPEGYRNEILMKKMKLEKFRKLVKEGKSREGQTPEDTEILPNEYSVYLKDVYQKEKFSKPRNLLGLQKDLPEAEMKKLILAHTVVGENELQALARERAGAVKAYLIKEGIAPERLFEKSADIYKPPAKGMGGSRVEFGASAK